MPLILSKPVLAAFLAYSAFFLACTPCLAWYKAIFGVLSAVNSVKGAANSERSAVNSKK